jgi:hypothetical protein
MNFTSLGAIRVTDRGTELFITFSTLTIGLCQHKDEIRLLLGIYLSKPSKPSKNAS